MARRPVAAVAAALLFVEAVGIVLVHVVLGRVVGGQSMSLAGLDPGLMSTSTFAMGGVFGLYLAVCGVVLLRAALRDRGPGRFARTLLITCAVTHGVLGALAVGLVGWQAFAFMMPALGLIVLSLIGYDRGLPALAAPEDAGAPGDGTTGNGAPATA